MKRFGPSRASEDREYQSWVEQIAAAQRLVTAAGEDEKKFDVAIAAYGIARRDASRSMSPFMMEEATKDANALIKAGTPPKDIPKEAPKTPPVKASKRFSSRKTKHDIYQIFDNEAKMPFATHQREEFHFIAAYMNTMHEGIDREEAYFKASDAWEIRQREVWDRGLYDLQKRERDAERRTIGRK